MQDTSRPATRSPALVHASAFLQDEALGAPAARKEAKREKRRDEDEERRGAMARGDKPQGNKDDLIGVQTFFELFGFRFLNDNGGSPVTLENA
jgi:hypothetical protein